jgi:hypothetical protein
MGIVGLRSVTDIKPALQSGTSADVWSPSSYSGAQVLPVSAGLHVISKTGLVFPVSTPLKLRQILTLSSTDLQ